MSAPTEIIFTDRDGDTISTVSYVARDHSKEFGNNIPDPIMSITSMPGTRGERSQSVVFKEDDAAKFIPKLAEGLLGDGWQAAIGIPTEVFLVAWTGGYEAPQYATRPTEAEAMDLGREWYEDSNGETDTVDVLRLNLADGSVTRLHPDED